MSGFSSSHHFVATNNSTVKSFTGSNVKDEYPLQVVINRLNSDVNEQSKWAKVDSKDLALGMFIIELDRLWHDAPFPVNGFHLCKFDQI